MNNDEIENIINTMREKLGEETSATIADDLASLMTSTNNYVQEINQKNDQIKNLEKDKNTLITANGNLLKQIPMGIEETEKEEKEQKEPYSFTESFDEYGNFK